MPLDELIGQRLAVGLPGPDATPDVIAHLRAIRAGGLVLFERNFSSAAQLAALLRSLEGALGRRLLVMADHEGGRVIRFRKDFTQFPSALAAGREADAAVAVERQGAVEARELARAGVRANLAPCVDVLAEGSDPIIGDRSYGADAELVSRLAMARIRGLQSHGVAACAKHFPGLGAVPRDPHKTLPTVALEREVLERVHWAPFRAAIEAGVAMVMSSHVCYPGLGEPPQRPATFSPALIRGLLRRQMGFQGLILTDDLLMGAIRARDGLGEAAVSATEAGHDLLLICDELLAQKEAFSALRQAYQGGRLPTSELEATAARLERFRNDFLS